MDKKTVIEDTILDEQFTQGLGPRTAKDAKRTADSIARSLKAVREKLRTEKEVEFSMPSYGLLHDIRDRGKALLGLLEYLRVVNEKLRLSDLGLFHELKALVENLPKGQQAEVLRQLKDEQGKIAEELDIEATAKLTGEYEDVLRETVENTLAALDDDDRSSAKLWLGKALKADREIQRLLKEIQRAEQKLRNIISGSWIKR